ncbi:hypothetical protein DPMN_189982 [Dreissena polymorpha]|uniref:Uncharacterized protein n=1 Tax=Dreissena polymorpha TaxID=45954 RepID=A0A9D4I9Z6_DREPO|nr:hypothetical protein DPMN_189982 [Dreissena polymorpha]
MRGRATFNALYGLAANYEDDNADYDDDGGGVAAANDYYDDDDQNHYRPIIQKTVLVEKYDNMIRMCRPNGGRAT